MLLTGTAKITPRYFWYQKPLFQIKQFNFNMVLKLLRKVNRFAASSNKCVDPWASEALKNSGSQKFTAFVNKIEDEWHRPSADQAILEENLWNYDTKLPKRCLDGDYLAILKKTLDELRPPTRLIPLTLGGAEKHPQLPKSTSPGFPWV